VLETSILLAINGEKCWPATCPVKKIQLAVSPISNSLTYSCLAILEFGLYHNESLPEGLQDVADTLTPKFVVMSVILFAFCLGCSIVLLEYEGSVSVDWVRIEFRKIQQSANF
jgi:hypothetical protein